MMSINLRTLLVAGSLMAAATASADDYGYFTLRTASGEATSFTAVGLKMTFSGGKLLATQNGQTTELAVDALDAMFFSTSASSTTAIDAIAQSDGTVEVFSLNGVRVAEGRLADLQLTKGVYIARQNGKSTKFVVK